MTTFVLVHGAWSGAHCFHKVRPLLRGAGHEVFTPSLTGIGERVHLASPQVNLSTHIRDVVNLVLYEDLSSIVLLGFSYGGMVVTGALEHIAERVSHLVYLDAFVPSDGDSVLAMLGHQLPTAITVGEAWFIPPTAREYDDPNEAAFANPRRTPQPLACFTESVRVRRPLEGFAFSRSYIKATGEAKDAPGTSAFWAAAARAQASDAWSYHEVATNHMIPQNRPQALAEILLKLGAG
jgi:pimeloyl-ACP methyl ester carboxylesterase